MDINYKYATIDDIDLIYELTEKLIKDYEDTSKIDLEKVLAWVRNKIEVNLSQYKAVYYGNEKVGYFRLYESDGNYELDDLYIFKNYRGLGIGSNILNYVDDICKANGKNISLYVFIKNKRAIDLYLRYGYIVVKNIKDSRYIMQKSF